MIHSTKLMAMDLNNKAVVQLKKERKMAFDFKSLPKSEKLILGSAVAAAIAVLMPWKDLGEFGSISGISDYGLIPLVLGWGPIVFMIFKPGKIKPAIAIITSIIAAIWGLLYLLTATVENPFTGESIFVGSIGIFIFCIAAAVLIYGSICKYKNTAGVLDATQNNGGAAPDKAESVSNVTAVPAVETAVPTVSYENVASKADASFLPSKYKISNSKIIGAKVTIAKLDATSEKDRLVYDLVKADSGELIFRFARTSTNLVGIDPATDNNCFTWQRLSSPAGELFTGSKWQCGNLFLSQSALRSLVMWIPRISWFIPSKYTITENNQPIATVSGSVFSFTNAKNIAMHNAAKTWEIMAAAIILSEDELG